MVDFVKFVYTPAARADAALAICACRAGGVGILNGELSTDENAFLRALDDLARSAAAVFGAKLDAYSPRIGAAIRAHAAHGLGWLIVDAEILSDCRPLIEAVRPLGVQVLAEVKSADWDPVALAGAADGLMLKGNESGGFVGEESSFILLQKWRQRTRLPLYVRGGLTPHVAAACATVGVLGGALDSQLLLMDEARLPPSLAALIRNLSGSETQAIGNGEAGEYFRVLVRPSLTAARQLVADGEGMRYAELRQRVSGQTGWADASRALLPIGQDVAFAAPWRKRFESVSAVLAAIDEAVATQPAIARRCKSISDGAPLASALGIRLPIIQGPMTRVSDTAEFALAVAEGGALPMVALAVLKGAALEELLKRTASQLGKRPWGIGLLGFAPQELLEEQLAVAARFNPSYAIIAGGRPDQAVQLETANVPTFLHVPSANLISAFLQEGARRFIFEGRECGGHIGPLSSFVLWSAMVDRLLAELAHCKVRADDVAVVFAGGIHDGISSAMLQVISAPLAAAGVKVGILMGSAYLFTKEIVATGSIVGQFQQEVLDCERTVNLESGVGHASRCARSPFASDFFRQRLTMKRSGIPADEIRRSLDELILGRLRIASKGKKRDGLDGELRSLEPEQQHEEGMYMLGQVATLRRQLTDIATLHQEATAGAAATLTEACERMAVDGPLRQAAADVAVVGIACALPKATTPQQYWENILGKVDAITEIPSHRWDWRTYFDADREAKDKIYSKWGGFLDDLTFDPMQYGMPPKSIEAVDPMQLMALEVAHRTLVDSGYHAKPFDRERASVIIGASGGIGDVGMQYGLRSELPRFSGTLPPALAANLPQWTEDSFAGILPNVAAGRIANRLNFGGMNLTTDAACASSLAAIYQAVTELAAERSDFVIAGGVDTVQGPFGYLCFSKTQALSPRGRCSTFDSAADGIVISEGIAMVALKRLSDAQRDGDRIYAVIKGVGASSDGSAKGMTAPLPAGQLRAMRRAYGMAGFGPSSVGLFEAHGTGTVVGDTAELESTTQLIREKSSAARQAAIGSVKTLIGHTKATAGAAGFIKAVLSLHHRVLPPHGNVATPNAVLADAQAPLYLLDEPMPWLAAAEQPRRAACSAFGFGGTNFHVVMEEYSGEYRDWLRPPPSHAWSAELLLFGESGQAALLAHAEAFAAALAPLDDVLLRDVAASLSARFRPLGHTLAVVARDLNDLRAKLGIAIAHLRGDAKPLPPGIFYGRNAQPAGKVAVLFSGQGSQYPNMAREAALHFDTMGATLAEADAVLKEPFETRFGADSRLSQFIFPRGAYDESAKAGAKQRLASTDVAQPALGAIEAGLFRVFQDLGLQPDMFAGHSYGEFVALHAAGAINFASLMQLSAARGRFIVDAAAAAGAELGTMAAVSAPRKRVEDALANVEGVMLANHNAPMQSVISGTHAAVKTVATELRLLEVEVTEIPVAAAFHSSLVRPAQAPLSALIETIDWSTPSAPVYSNTTGRMHSSDPGEIKRQMAEHLIQPVEFVAEIEAMYADGARTFVEIGPKPVLARLVSRIIDRRPHLAIAVDDGSGLTSLLGAVARLVCAGIKLDTSRLFAHRDCRVGDPLQPATLQRTQAISKHAWLLNGSSARRLAEPPKQVGVTFEQAQAAAAPPEPACVAAPAEIIALQPRQVPAIATSTVQPPTRATQRKPPRAARPIFAVPTAVWKKDRPMDERRIADSSVILSEYFETMRQFLETQERVMATFLGGSTPLSSGRGRLLSMNEQRAAELAEAPAVTPTARLHVPVAPPLPNVSPQVAASKSTPASPGAAPRPVATAATVGATPAVAAPPPAASKPPPADAQAPKPNGAGYTREKLLDCLLGIVEEKTGYPRDMLGLDQHLESDLGIDSIKRVEVVSALLKLLPDSQREALTQNRGKLNTESTLNGILNVITQLNGAGVASGPFDSAGAGKETGIASGPSRLVIRSEIEPLIPAMGRRLMPGPFLLTRDALGVADILARTLNARGAQVQIVELSDLASEARLKELCGAVSVEQKVAGIVHLAALGGSAIDSSQGPADWRATLHVNEKSLFLLLRELHGRLTPEAHIVAACGLGGLFGREGSAGGELSLQGGAPGLLKSLFEERPDLRVKAVDLDLSRSPAQLASDLFGEIELDGGHQEVGYPAGQRTIFRTEAADVAIDSARDTELMGLVILATGGARGITAETLREFARPGNTLILTGRSRLPETESPDTASLGDAAALRASFIAQARTGALTQTPGEIKRRVQSILDLRELRANLADFRTAGATVEYHSVDVTDEAALGALVADIQRRHQRIDGVVHGAGVIEDKLLADKSSDSWSRVVDTKLIGLLLLQKLIDPAALKFFVAFSSVAGRYGNSGQSDYATANELMNRVCVSLQARWGARVAVSALCWGPWGPTKFGAGMVTPETEAKFDKRGVYLVSAGLGRRLLRQEIARADGTPVEVICGEGPWESEEARRAAFRAPSQAAAPSSDSAPLLGNCASRSASTGAKSWEVRLDAARHVFVKDCPGDGAAALPLGAAAELIAEAARALWPRWCVAEIRELRVLGKIVLVDGMVDVKVQLNPPPFGSSEGFEVSATLSTKGSGDQWHSSLQCVLGVERSCTEADPVERSLHKERSLSVRKVYEECLSRGSLLQVIERIDGLSGSGAAARVRSTRPSGWLTCDRACDEKWIFDPALLDAAEQMASLWARSYRGETVTAVRYGRIVRHRDGVPAHLDVSLALTHSEQAGGLRCNVVFCDDFGKPVLTIEELDCSTSLSQAVHAERKGATESILV